MFYTVLVTSYEDGIEDQIVFEGRRPYITNSKIRAELFTEQLKKEFPKASYRVGEIRVI